MKGLSLNIISRIKWFKSIAGSGSNTATITEKKEDRLHNYKLEIESGHERKENFDLALFQRKAYCGNYIAGPCIFLNPDLFY